MKYTKYPRTIAERIKSNRKRLTTIFFSFFCVDLFTFVLGKAGARQFLPTLRLMHSSIFMYLPKINRIPTVRIKYFVINFFCFLVFLFVAFFSKETVSIFLLRHFFCSASECTFLNGKIVWIRWHMYLNLDF